MVKINLRNLFPEYELDCYIEVPDGDIDAFLACITREIAAVYIAFERAEAAYMRRLFWNKAHYSLDRNDGIENLALEAVTDPAAEYERKLTAEQLHAAINSLPDKQAKRIYAHFILGMSNKAIARAEGVDARNVRASISRGLRRLSHLLKNIF